MRSIYTFIVEVNDAEDMEDSHFFHVQYILLLMASHPNTLSNDILWVKKVQ